jgi:hypothetical protein
MDSVPITAQALRYGVVVLARADRHLTDATLQSIAGLRDAPDAIALVASKLRAHLFDDAASNSSSPPNMRVLTSEHVDQLPLADGFRAMAGKVDVIVFVPEGVVLDPDYLTTIRETAERWQDMVGELDVVHRVVAYDRLARNFADASKPDEAERGAPRSLGLLQSFRARTLCANVLWVRVEACGNLKFLAFPQTSEYLAFSSLLDQLRPRGRTRVVISDRTVQVRSGPERRSGFEAGRELYAALSRIGEWRDRSDAAFEDRPTYLEPRAEKIRLFGEQFVRFLASPATRAHVGSFIKGMWAARREASVSRHRIREDIRRLR